MLFELGLVFLLLPLAAWSGWSIGKRATQHRSEDSSKEFARDYLRGMNYLLSEQPDKAIEVFLHLASVDNDTFETHLALGALFRRRGEVDRAIRIHQNLIARPSLSVLQREQGLFELAQDYLKLGVLDRAEAILSDLKSGISETPQVLELLLQIYEREKDWRSALATASMISGRAQSPLNAVRTAQYNCELADQALQAGHVSEVRVFLNAAFRADPACVRASVLEARLATADGDHRQALRSLLRILDQDARFLTLVIDSILELYGRLGDLSGRQAFIERLGGHGGSQDEAQILDAIRLRLKMDEDPADALRRYAAGYPTIHGLHDWLQGRLERGNGIPATDLALFGETLGKVLAQGPLYRCGQCGFAGRKLHWQCPGCQQWGTIAPLACLPNGSIPVIPSTPFRITGSEPTT